jgi:hypothetical protein
MENLRDRGQTIIRSMYSTIMLEELINTVL